MSRIAARRVIARMAQSFVGAKLSTVCDFPENAMGAVFPSKQAEHPITLVRSVVDFSCPLPAAVRDGNASKESI